MVSPGRSHELPGSLALYRVVRPCTGRNVDDIDVHMVDAGRRAASLVNPFGPCGRQHGWCEGPKQRLVSSEEEQFLYTEKVTGSIPVPGTAGLFSDASLARCMVCRLTGSTPVSG